MIGWTVGSYFYLHQFTFSFRNAGRSDTTLLSLYLKVRLLVTRTELQIEHPFIKIFFHKAYPERRSRQTKNQKEKKARWRERER